jgi:hypothetical protein
MRRIRVLLIGVVLQGITVYGVLAGEKQKSKIDFTKAAVVLPLEYSVAEAASSPLAETMQKNIIACLKEAALFSAVLTPEEAKDKDKATLIEITGKWEDFRTTAGILGFGPECNVLDITIRDSATGNMLWKKRFKVIVPSAFQRSALPETAAKELVQELKYEKKPPQFPHFEISPFAGEMTTPGKPNSLHDGVEWIFGISRRFSLNIDTGFFPYREIEDDPSSEPIRISFSPSYHFARRFGRILDPFLVGGITLRIGEDHLEDFKSVDSLINLGGGINFWFSRYVGLKLEFRDHVWFSHGIASHYVDKRVAVCFRSPV